jgi:predicted HTH transcriptional regulator
MASDIIKILIIFIAGVIVGGYLPIRLREAGPVLALKEPSLAAKQREKKELKKQIIMEQVVHMPESRITSEDVGKMFSVSRTTAAKYLDELEEEGKLKKIIIGDHAENSVVYYSRV